MADLTARQRQVFQAIVRCIHDGLPPTYRELCDELGFKSTNGAADHVRVLIEKGLLEKLPNRARALSLTAAGRDEVYR